MNRPRQDIERLVAALHEHDATGREAAIARLRVIGSRAVARLSLLAQSDAPAPARAAAFAALEGARDPRTADLALAALSAASAEVVIAALGVLRSWVTREDGTRVLEALTVVALDKNRDATVRLAALDALSELPRHLVAPVREHAPEDTEAIPSFDDPRETRAWLVAHDTRAPLPAIYKVLVGARERERTPPAARSQEWLSVRGAAHAALARRGSRIAVYDLREAFDAARTPLPLDFLVAIIATGDATCLEPLARAWAAAASEPWWRERMTEAAADIVRRLRLTGRSAIIKRIRSKWEGFL